MLSLFTGSRGPHRPDLPLPCGLIFPISLQSLPGLCKKKRPGKRVKLEREKIWQSQRFENLLRSETVKRKDK